MPLYNRANKDNDTQSSSNSCHGNSTNDLYLGNENFYDNSLNFNFHEGNWAYSNRKINRDKFPLTIKILMFIKMKEVMLLNSCKELLMNFC